MLVCDPFPCRRKQTIQYQSSLIGRLIAVCLAENKVKFAIDDIDGASEGDSWPYYTCEGEKLPETKSLLVVIILSENCRSVNHCNKKTTMSRTHFWDQSSGHVRTQAD
jgi:hypothetical protein